MGHRQLPEYTGICGRIFICAHIWTATLRFVCDNCDLNCFSFIVTHNVDLFSFIATQDPIAQPLVLLVISVSNRTVQRRMQNSVLNYLILLGNMGLF
jgi:hypothetical protein